MVTAGPPATATPPAPAAAGTAGPGTTGPGRAGAGTTGPGTGGPGSPAGWRRWRAPALLVALILMAAVVVALLQIRPPVTGPLDPRDTGPAGSHALVALLAGRGQTVIRAQTVPAALAQARPPGTVLVITSPGRLAPASLRALAGSGASLLVVAPGPGALAILAPPLRPAGTAPAASEAPRCRLPAAALAGPADLGGLLMTSGPPGTWHCYPAGAGAALVSYRRAARTITVIGTAAPLTNGWLGRDGNAALALSLLGASHRVVWLVPGPVTAAAPAGGQRSVTGLIPLPVYLIAIQLGVAAALAAAWRMRRFGPLVFEPLPVTVRASETVEGHGRLYRARRARGRAAAVLRGACITRMTSRLGLPAPVAPDALCQELSARTGRQPSQIGAILFGPAPADDAGLVRLASDLDSLEGQVLSL